MNSQNRGEDGQSDNDNRQNDEPSRGLSNSFGDGDEAQEASTQ
jgi:hypothetical protein